MAGAISCLSSRPRQLSVRQDHRAIFIENGFSFLREFADACKREKFENALIDGLNLEGPISIWDRYQLGEEYIRLIGPKFKVALVVKRYLIDLTMENVVVNRAVRFKMFHEIESALKRLAVEA